MTDNLLDFDFGFTAVDENELEAVQKVVASADSATVNAYEAEEKLNKLYNAILPLLSNLKKESREGIYSLAKPRREDRAV